MNRFTHSIFRLVLAILPVLLAVANARAQEAYTVCAGESSVLEVVAVEGNSYVWELYSDVENIDLVNVPGNCPPADAYFVGGVNTGPAVEVMWMTPGVYFFKVTATDTCTNNIKVGRVEVIGCLSYADFLDPEPVCSGDTAWLTVVITGAPGPWDITFTDGIDTYTVTGITTSPYTFPLIPTPNVPGNYEYWITSVTNTYDITNPDPGEPVILIVKPKPVTSPIYRY